MRFLRLPVKDPRTVARDIPGVCDLLFPQLLPAIIAHLNREAMSVSGSKVVSSTLFNNRSINAAMLFEVAYARTEQMIGEFAEDWDDCLNIALNRQSRYFDAELPDKLSEVDVEIANITAYNLLNSLNYFQQSQLDKNIIMSPDIPGYHWIASGNGDFSIGTMLIEVKCSGQNFSSSDYRQILMYWLLSYASAVENNSDEWKHGLLLNPRLNKYVEVDFSELVKIAGAGRSKVDILELFSDLIGDCSLKLES